MGKIRPLRVVVLGRFASAPIILSESHVDLLSAQVPLCREPDTRQRIFFIKFNLKIAKMCENFSTLNKVMHMLCIAYKKLVVVKLKFKFL
jgi:hypothetical protein